MPTWPRRSPGERPRSSSPGRSPRRRDLGDVTAVRVADPLAALGAVAAGWRRRFDPLVVGVTGSIAKTSTKEAIAAVLGRRFRTLRNEGNQNNEVGLPLTVLRLRPEHEAAVLEMGMYVGGEIADLARIARPRIGVVTAVQAVHLSRIGSLAGHRAGQGRAARGAPARRHRHPQRRRPDRPPDGPPVRGTGGQLRLRRRRRRRRGGGRVARARRDALRPARGRRATDGHDPGPGPPVGPQRAGRGGRRPRRRDDARRDRGGPRRRLVGAAPRRGRPSRRRDHRRRHVQRLAAVGHRRARPARRAAGPARRGPRRDARARRRVRRGPPRGRRGGGPDRGLADGRRARAPRASPRAPRRPAWPASAIHRVRDADAALSALPPRLRDGDVVLVKASRGVALDTVVDGLRRELGGGRSAR